MREFTDSFHWTDTYDMDGDIDKASFEDKKEKGRNRFQRLRVQVYVPAWKLHEPGFVVGLPSHSYFIEKKFAVVPLGKLTTVPVVAAGITHGATAPAGIETCV